MAKAGSMNNVFVAVAGGVIDPRAEGGEKSNMSGIGMSNDFSPVTMDQPNDARKAQMKQSVT